MPIHRNAYLLLILTTLFWGGNAVAGKLAVGQISPMLLNTVRWLIAALVLGYLCRHRLAAEWQMLRDNALFLFALGAFGMTGFGLTLYVALTYTTAINASIEQSSMPLVVFLANFVLFGMRVTLAQLAGFCLSVIGVALTVSHGDLTRLAALDLNIGDAIMLFGVVLYGAYTVALRFKPALHWQTFMFALTVAAFVGSAPFAIVEYFGEGGGLPTTQGWLIALYAGLFPSLLSQVFFVRGVELIGANRTGLFINLVPIFGTLLSILILGEAFHAYHALALVLVLGGIWLAETGGRKVGAAR